MALYVFYPTLGNGLANSLETLDVADDDAAIQHCALVLRGHASAKSVVVYAGNRKVHAEQRAGDPTQSAQG